jgi:transposase
MSPMTRRQFSTGFKRAAVERMLAGESVHALAAELGVRAKLLFYWRQGFCADGDAGLNRKRGPKRGAPRASGPGAAPRDDLALAQARIAELEAKIGRQQMELDFFQRALRLTQAAGPPAARASTRSSTP